MQTKMRLYDIPILLRAALDAVEVDEETGEVIGLEELDAVKVYAADDVEGVALYIRELSAEAVAARVEIERLSKIAASATRRIERLKAYMAPALQALGGKVKTGRVSVGFRKSEAVVIDCPVEALPDAFKVEKTTVAADKKALKEALKGGEIVEGVTLEERQNVIIK